jgi:hypothetical protein
MLILKLTLTLGDRLVSPLVDIVTLWDCVAALDSLILKLDVCDRVSVGKI